MPNVGFREWMALGGVIASGQLVRYAGGEGKRADTFERRFAETVGVKHALAMNSGTSALISALAAAGIGPGDEVLVPAYTWVATAIAPLAVGAVPILVDIDETLTIDPADIEAKITPHTKAIIPVHMINAVCDMDRIMAIAAKHDLIVIEDACQAVGVRYKAGHAGGIGHAGAFSFNQYKNINVGEGGAIATNDDRIFARARMFHDAGAFIRGHENGYNEPAFAGRNYRITELEGAMLNVQLSKLGPMLTRLRKRRQIVEDILGRSDKFRISPHNDPENAVTLSVIFETKDEAEAFAHNRGVYRLQDNSKHVYTHWEPLFTKRSFHPKMDPYAWAHREIEYSPDMCKRTLGILERTCRINLGAEYPAAVMAFLAKRLVQA
ncbi:MAG: aminotransferase class I/II-fold pyridoxal phosphate-dependent enzyme [Maricaulaceae bacterium]|jgi:dTDP-4-amino-4,6-dideoxygalactose transaminase